MRVTSYNIFIVVVKQEVSRCCTLRPEASREICVPEVSGIGGVALLGGKRPLF